MSEISIQQKVQAVIQALALFENADVVINDWSIFDRPNIEAPYVLIEVSDEFESVQVVMTPENRWAVPLNLVEAFTDWQETYNNFRDRRQVIIDAFNGTGSARADSGLNIERIYNDGAITPYFDKTIPAELQSESLPVFIMQRIIMEGLEF